MAARKPLVLISGRVAQLPAGDTLAAASAEIESINVTNANVSALPIGTPVYVSADDAVDAAEANAAGTSEVVGLVQSASIAPAAVGAVQTSGNLVATTGQWDAITGGTGGLTAGSTYFLDAATPGKLTTTAPSGVGEFVTRVGRALSTTEMIINAEPSIAL